MGFLWLLTVTSHSINSPASNIAANALGQSPLDTPQWSRIHVLLLPAGCLAINRHTAARSSSSFWARSPAFVSSFAAVRFAGPHRLT